MHGNLLSCVNRIKHEEVNFLPRFQPPWRSFQSKDSVLGPYRMACYGPFHYDQGPDHEHHLSPYSQYILQCADHTGQYRYSRRHNLMPGIFQCHHDLYGQQQPDDRLYGHRYIDQNLEGYRRVRQYRYLCTEYYRRRQYLAFIDLPRI